MRVGYSSTIQLQFTKTVEAEQRLYGSGVGDKLSSVAPTRSDRVFVL